MVVSVQVAPPDFDRVFAALADHTRRDIVRRAISGKEGVLELASHYPMSFAAVQKHVAVLEHAGLITKQHVGRRHRHGEDKGEQTMTVTAVRKDPQRLTLTVEAEFDASVERIWQLWADPRKLERWWGPPNYPATFTNHDLAPGSRIEYHMTGPAGDQPHGYWDVLEVEPPRRIVLRGGCAYADGTLTTEVPISTIRVGIEEVAQGRTRMSIENVFPSTEAMEQVLAMGTEEGLSQAVGQIDAILAEETIQR